MVELARSRSWLGQLFIRAGVSREDRQRRVYPALMICVLVPAAGVFAAISFRAVAPQAGWAITGMAVSLMASWGVIRWSREIRSGYRIVLLAVLPLLAWLIHLGNGGGYAFLWAYLLPPSIFYVFGTKEGTFLFAELSREKQELESALDEVRTLADMIPMCAWCRNVRDDAGYWSRIEDYLARRSLTVVTHGLCPDCAEKRAEGGDGGAAPVVSDPTLGPSLV